MHKTIEPTTLYFGTPVVLIRTLNPHGSPNLAPMSSAWWLGWSCMLGLGQMGQTSDNLIRTRDCVILPSVNLVTHVDRLVHTTGKNPVPERKRQWGYRYEPDKFGVAGLTPVASQSVAPPCVLECPIQMEGMVQETEFGKCRVRRDEEREVLRNLKTLPFYGLMTSVCLSRCATSMRLTSAAQSSCPTGVRPYQTVGGDVGLVKRAMIPSRSSFRRQLVSTLAETLPISN